MAATCPTGFDVDQLRAAVRSTYERVARDPAGDFHFHRGVDYACEYLGYDRHELAVLPEVSTARFAGVGNPLRLGTIGPGFPEPVTCPGNIRRQADSEFTGCHEPEGQQYPGQY